MQYTQKCFLELIIPNIYQQIESLAEIEGVDPTETVLIYYSTKIIVSLAGLEEHHSKRLTELSFLYDTSKSAKTLQFQTLAQSWFSKKRQKSAANVGVEPKILLKRVIRDLRSSE